MIGKKAGSACLLVLALLSAACAGPPPAPSGDQSPPPASPTPPPSEPPDGSPPPGPPGGPGPGGPSGGPPGPLPPGPICGPGDWFPDLFDFVRRIAGGDSPPAWLNFLSLFGDPIVSVPYSLRDGFREAYRPLASALPDRDCPRIAGDPHILTVDGVKYDFQAAGEFTALASTTDDLDVQVRLIPVGDKVSVVRGVAARIDGRVLVIDTAIEPMVTVDGEPLEAPAIVETDGGGLILRDGPVVGVIWPDLATTISVTGVAPNRNLNLYATTAIERSGNLAGLLGNADGSAGNDLALRDGTPVSNEFEQLYGPFRDAWRVAESESLFSGPSTWDPSQPSGPAEFSAAERAAARAACVDLGVIVIRLLEDCTFDVAATGDESYARRYADEHGSRVLVPSQCSGSVGALVSMAGYDAAHTYAQADGGLIDGELDWEFSIEGTPAALVLGVAPTATGFVVVDGRRGFHFTDDKGQLLSTFEARPRPGATAPVATTGRAFGILTDSLVALASDGTPCWQLLAHDVEQFQTVGFDAGRVFVTSGLNGVGTIIVLDAETGALLWSRSFLNSINSWAASDERIMVGTAGALVALDATSGTRVWADEDGFLIGAIAVGGGTAYALDLNNGLGAYNLASGQESWRYKPAVGEAYGFTTDLALAGDRGVIVNERYAIGLNLTDGSLVWVAGQDVEARFSQPIISGDVVYFLRDDLTLVAHDLAGGELVLSVAIPERAREIGSPLAWNDKVLVIDRDRILRAYR